MSFATARGWLPEVRKGIVTTKVMKRMRALPLSYPGILEPEAGLEPATTSSLAM